MEGANLTGAILPQPQSAAISRQTPTEVTAQIFKAENIEPPALEEINDLKDLAFSTEYLNNPEVSKLKTAFRKLGVAWPGKLDSVQDLYAILQEFKKFELPEEAYYELSGTPEQFKLIITLPDKSSLSFKPDYSEANSSLRLISYIQKNSNNRGIHQGNWWAYGNEEVPLKSALFEAIRYFNDIGKLEEINAIIATRNSNIEHIEQAPMKIENLTFEAYKQLRTMALEQHFKAVGSYPTQTILEMISNGGENITINSKNLEQLEEMMRPGTSSSHGFLGSDESLINVLREDDTFVNSSGLTHQDMVLPLIMAVNTYYATKREEQREFVFMGEKYNVTGTTWMGHQTSPFGFGKGSSDIVVANSSGEELSFPELITKLIPFGFYEGQDTPYRTSPKDIADFFRLNELPKDQPNQSVQSNEGQIIDEQNDTDSQQDGQGDSGVGTRGPKIPEPNSGGDTIKEPTREASPTQDQATETESVNNEISEDQLNQSVQSNEGQIDEQRGTDSEQEGQGGSGVGIRGPKIPEPNSGGDTIKEPTRTREANPTQDQVTETESVNEDTDLVAGEDSTLKAPVTKQATFSELAENFTVQTNPVPPLTFDIDETEKPTIFTDSPVFTGDERKVVAGTSGASLPLVQIPLNLQSKQEQKEYVSV